MTTPWPSGVIDPHIHLWDPLTTRRATSGLARVFRPLPRIPRAMRWIAPRADREFVGHPHHILKPYLPVDHHADAAEIPVETVVHIEAGWPTDERRDSVDETRWVTALPFDQAGAPRLGALVVHVDPRFDDAGAILDEHLEVSPLVRGVRFAAAHHPDPGVRDFADEPHVLRDPEFLKGFAAIAERGLSFDVWCYSHQLPDAITLAQEFPETTFVLDHYATPVGLLGPRGKSTGRSEQERDALLAAWHDDVAALAALPNVVAKHSGIGMPLLGSQPVTTAGCRSAGGAHRPGRPVDQACPRHLRRRPYDVGVQLPDRQGRTDPSCDATAGQRRPGFRCRHGQDGARCLPARVPHPR